MKQSFWARVSAITGEREKKGSGIERTRKNKTEHKREKEKRRKAWSEQDERKRERKQIMRKLECTPTLATCFSTFV